MVIGFGISNEDIGKDMSEFDGVVIGSSFIKPF